MTRTSFSRWVLAARLRTLPLACSTVLLGSGLAAHADAFRWPLFLLCLLTAILLQVLSNLANDYGDYLDVGNAGNIVCGRIVFDDSVLLCVAGTGSASAIGKNRVT